MRKLLLCLALVATMLSLSSCFPSTPWDEGKLRDTFFADEVLMEYGVEDLPAPRLEGAYLDESGGILYLNLTREKYEEYVRRVVGYLGANEELTVSGYLCEKGIFGLLIIPIPEYRFAPLDDERIDYTSGYHHFMFSGEYIEYYGDEVSLEDEHHLTIRWNPTEHGRSGIASTVEVKLGGLHISTYLPCYHGHDMSHGTYPVPGTAEEVTVSTCRVCGEEQMDRYIGGDDMTRYKVTLAEDAEHVNKYLIDLPEAAYAGTLREIYVSTSAEGIVQISVNGTEIPCAEVVKECRIYRFIMPTSDIEISVIVSP